MAKKIFLALVSVLLFVSCTENPYTMIGDVARTTNEGFELNMEGHKLLTQTDSLIYARIEMEDSNLIFLYKFTQFLYQKDTILANQINYLWDRVDRLQGQLEDLRIQLKNKER